MSEKNSVTCPDCGKMYRDFAPEGDPTCQCAEKAVRAMKEAQLNERCKGDPPAIPRDEERRLRAMTAFSDETGREPFQSPQHIIEGIILRRLHDKRIEGYTLEMSKEIEAALSASPVGDDVPALKERIRLLEWAIAAKDKQILQFSDALSAPVAQEPVATKKVYIKPLRTIVEIQTAYADQIRDWLNTSTPAPPAAPVVQEPVATKATQQASADFLHEEMIKLGSPLTYTACLTLTKRITDTNTLAWAGEVNKLCTEIGSLKNEIAALKSAATPPATPAGVGADEIARIIEPAAFAELCRVGNEDAYWDDQEKKASALKKANAILALLSRGSWSDQTKLQKDGSR